MKEERALCFMIVEDCWRGISKKARNEDVSERHTEFWKKGQLCLEFPTFTPQDSFLSQHSSRWRGAGPWLAYCRTGPAWKRHWMTWQGDGTPSSLSELYMGAPSICLGDWILPFPSGKCMTCTQSPTTHLSLFMSLLTLVTPTSVCAMWDHLIWDATTLALTSSTHSFWIS